MSATIATLLPALRRRFEAAGIESAALDARLLIEAGAGVSALAIAAEPQRALSDAELAAIDALARRREAREPMAHILGRKAFWTFDLAVSPAVLIPRPETELLVETALAVIAPEAPARVLDLGVGSGAILLAILSERPRAQGVGVDISAAALGVARANGEALGLSARVQWREGDWAVGVAGPFDVIVSNPPYIRAAAIGTLAPEIASHEPHLALDGGGDGLDAYRAIIPSLARLLAPGGAFALEVGEGQAERVKAMAEAAGLEAAPPRHDLAGHARVVSGRRRPG